MNAILSWSVQCFVVTAVMIPVAMLLCRCFRYRPAVQHALWVVVLLKFVTPSVVDWPWRLPDLETSSVSHMSEQIDATATADLQPITLSNAGTTKAPGQTDGRKWPETSRSLLSGRADVSAVQAMTGLLMTIWLAGSLVFAVRQYRRVKQQVLLLRGGIAAPPELSAAAQEVALRIGLQPIPLLIVHGISSPFVWCLGRLKLAWPEQMRQDKTTIAARSIIAHEFAHLLRRDHWVAWLELVAATIWWWNPLFWLVRRNLRSSAEIACDALALEAYPEDRCVYAELLLELSTVPNKGPSALVLNVSASNVVHFERRMSMIVSDLVSSKFSAGGVLLAGLLALAALPSWSFGQPNKQERAAERKTDDGAPAAAPRPKVDGEEVSRPPTIRNFAVFPIKTALQRRLMGWPIEDRANACAFVVINGMAVCNDAGLIDEKVLDTQALRKALTPYTDSKNGIVFMNVQYNSSPARNRDAEKLVVWALEGLGKDIGFKSARGLVTYHNDLSFDWARETALLNELVAARADEDEEPVGDDTVKVYPVRTAFSSFLTHASCVVDISTAANREADSVLPESVRLAILKYVSQSRFREKQMIMFKVQITEFEDRQRDKLLRELDALAKALGFSGSSVTF